MPRCPTPKDVIHREGTAELVRFRQSSTAKAGGPPVLLVPSLINRWYVMDLRPGVSLAGSLVDAGFDVWLLDWGIPNDEDRHLSWDDVLARLARAVRRVKKETGAPKIGLLGYCIGGTLTAIHTAQHPEEIAGLVNLAGPIDFSHAGFLGRMVQPEFFDVDAIAAAGNVSALQMQSGFVALRPTLSIAKWVGLADRAHDPKAREAFESLEEWSSDNIPFPAAAYATYIRELYQENRLVRGEHRARGREVNLAKITCPVLTVVTDRDTICPPAAAQALGAAARPARAETLVVPGGHVGAVVGSKAKTILYPALAKFFAGATEQGACSSIN